MTFSWQGKVYQFADYQSEPKRHSSPARPWEISIKGDCNSSSGELGIVKVALINATERAVMYPKRGGVYNPKLVTIQPRPQYVDEHGEIHYKVQCSRCGDYQRRDAFYPDPRRPNGLRGYCRTCESAMNHKQYLRRKAQTRKAA